MTLGSSLSSLGGSKRAEIERLAEQVAALVEELDAVHSKVARLEEVLDDRVDYQISSVEAAVQENEAITQRGIADLRAKVDLLAKEAGVTFVLKGPTEEHWEVEQPEERAIREQRFMGAATVSFAGRPHLYSDEELAHELETEEFFAAKRDKKKKK